MVHVVLAPPTHATPPSSLLPITPPSYAPSRRARHPDKANEFYEHLPRVSQCLQEAAGDWKAALELYLVRTPPFSQNPALRVGRLNPP